MLTSQFNLGKDFVFSLFRSSSSSFLSFQYVYVRPDVYVYMSTRTPKYRHKYVYVYMCTHTHTYRHTYVYVYVHTYTYI